jgi:hypothetical protein
VPALVERAARLRAIGLRIDGPAEGAAGRAYLDAATRAGASTPARIAATAPIWTVESIGRGRVGPVSAFDAERAQLDAVADAPTFDHVRTALRDADRGRPYPVAAQRLRDAISAALAASPQAQRPVDEIAARIGPDVARRLALALDPPRPASTPRPSPPRRAPPRPSTPRPSPPRRAPPRPSTPRPVDAAPASGDALPLPLLAAAGLGVALLLGATRK